MQISSKYAVQTNISMKDLKESGYKAEIKQPKGKPYQVAVFTKGDETFMATTAREFKGDITEDTAIVFGKNANQEDRLYLTNNSNGMETVKVLF